MPKNNNNNTNTVKDQRPKVYRQPQTAPTTTRISPTIRRASAQTVVSPTLSPRAITSSRERAPPPTRTPSRLMRASMGGNKKKNK